MRVCTKTEGAGILHDPTQPQTYTIQIDQMKEDNDPDQNNNANQNSPEDNNLTLTIYHLLKRNTQQYYINFI